MPYVSKMVEIGNEKYLDGALGDSIPIKKMESMGYDKIIVVLTKPYGYKKKKRSPLISKLRYKNYKELQQAINTRYLHYNKTIDYINEKEKTGEIIVLRPSRKVKMSRIEKDVNKLQVLFKILFAKKKSDKSKTVKSAVEEVLNSPDTAVEDTKNKLKEIEKFLKK